MIFQGFEDANLPVGEDSFEYMKELIDQVYGVETSIIDRAENRKANKTTKIGGSAASKPKPNRQGINKKFNSSEGGAAGVGNSKRLDAKTFLATTNESKERNQSLKEFLTTYNVYIHKILLAKTDPFIDKQNRQYMLIHEKMQ